MNCYNGAEYLKEALDSIVNQTYENWELIFWDNLSTDQSKSIFENYDNKKFKYFQSQYHTSQYEARRSAVLKCEGELIAFLDVDDWWGKKKLEMQVNLFNDPEVGFACCNYWIINQRKKTKKIAFKTIPTGYVTDELLTKNFVGMSTLIMRRQSYFSLDYGFDPRYEIIGDYDLILRLSRENKLACLNQPCSYYRWHGKNLGFLKFDLNISELSYWSSNKLEFSNYKNFKYLKNYILFYRGLINIMNKKRLKAFNQIYSMTSIYFQIKLSIVLFLPLWLIKMIRS